MESSKPTLNYPNEHIFTEYGSLDDSNSTIARAQFLLLRHGESNFNSFAKIVRQNLAEEGGDKLTQFKKEVIEFSDV